MADIIPYQSDAYVKVSALTNKKTGAVITDATVTVTFWSRNDEAVTGASGLSAVYDTPSAAYWVMVPKEATFVLGRTYRREVIAVSGGVEMKFSGDVFVERYPA